MENKNRLAKGLAIVGTVLLWLMVLVPLLFGLVSLSRSGIFRLDFLLPAELFPVFVIAIFVLLWGQARARIRMLWIWWSAAAGAVVFILVNVLAVATGLASGKTAAQGWPLYLVTACLALYILSIISAGIGGIMLIKRLFSQHESAS